MSEEAAFCFLVTRVVLFNGFLFNLYSRGSYFLTIFSSSSFLKEYMRWVNRGSVLREATTSEASLKRLLLMSSSFNFYSADMSVGRSCSRLPLSERLSRF